MITASVNLSAQQELAALHGVLERYHGVSKRDVSDTLAKKANDIRIELYRGYWAQRWKGTRKGSLQSEGVAFRDMRRRARNGEGVQLHPRRLSNPPSSKAPVQYFQRRKLRGASGTTRKLRVPVTMSTYQRRVWTELAARQAGIGVLGVAFLMQRYRRRMSVSQGRVVTKGLVRNRTGLDVQTQTGLAGRVLGQVTTAPTFARIEGFVEGHESVGDRHGILAIALRNVRQDTELYLARKAEESMRAELQAGGLLK